MIEVQKMMEDIKSRLDLHSSPPEGALYSFSTMKLTEEENLKAFVQCYGPLLKALDDKVVAAYFANWFSNVALSLQYSLSKYSSALDLSLSNLLLHLVPTERSCWITFSVEEVRFIPAPTHQREREDWCKEILTTFYRDTAAPLIRLISEVCGLAIGEVWGQMPTKFNYYFEVWEKEISDCNQLQQLREDYHYLMHGLPAEVFGLSRNPFLVTVRNVESLTDSEATIQLRNRCCLHYLTIDGDYCYRCPRIKEEERASRRLEYRKQMASSDV
ncbi:Fe-S oxidoreductase [Paenibacillus sp. FSL R10-2734]|uniref:Fe-S oxidoreductase n=1 Tax=Paenibacillus sp. FSL R10-2734 TaxID=2954691 RepID=UPI0030D9FD19